MASTLSLACLDVPPAAGWQRLQERWVDRVKRVALRQLHRSAAGERLLLRIYLLGEEATEQALQRELVSERPAWLARQMDQHLAEEQGHARAFAHALAQRGRPARAHDAGRPDALSRRKIAQWHRLARRHAPRFASGMLVPAFAIGLCAEQMASRVLRRHCDVIDARHPLASLLARVLADEERHVRLCQGTLGRIVGAGEWSALEALLDDVRAIDRSFGVTGALGMLAAGLLLRLAPPGRR
jgi:hypothetical protein